MPSSTGVAYTDLDDLMVKWFAFAVVNGWTQNQLDTSPPTGGSGSISKGGLFTQYIWETLTARLFHFQSLSFDGSTPGLNPDDAGPFGNITSQQRGTIIGDGPGTADFFFGTEAGADYLVCIAETQPDLFRYWAIGELIKVGDWTGGEWSAQQSWPAHQSVSADQDAPFDSRNQVMFNARFGDVGGQGGVLHLEGVPGQASPSKWGEFRGSGNASSDRNGDNRTILEGQTRDGPWYSSMFWLAANPNNGFVPLMPLPVNMRSGAAWTLLGFIPGLRNLNITFISPREEFTLGADVWRAYPWVKKSNALGGGPESGLANGWAVLKTP